MSQAMECCHPHRERVNRQQCDDYRMLDIVTAISNPLGWESRIQLAKYTILDWLKNPNVRVTLVECAYGDRCHDLRNVTDDPRFTHIPVRASTVAWNKECLLNLGISRLPDHAKYIATFDADVLFRLKNWAMRTIQALDIHKVVQPWCTAYDLGPNDEHIHTHRSFAYIYGEGGPLVEENGCKFWKERDRRNPYTFPHPGYAWAWRRDALDDLGGLFEYGGMGSGDHHMALALVGRVTKSVPEKANLNYLKALLAWQDRALKYVNRNIGVVNGTIEHMYHGSKPNRRYNGRWHMFCKHDFDPLRDLKRNTHGVLEFAGNKPELERQFMQYMKSRYEDSNIM